MVIYMDQYRMAKAAPAAWLKNGTYGGEAMQAAFHPVVLQLVSEKTAVTASPDLPDDMSNPDVDEFLQRIYELASLI
ncbi:MAG: hypothetical protein ABIS45_05145 [Burkholderiales bacterium]